MPNPSSKIIKLTDEIAKLGFLIPNHSIPKTRFRVKLEDIYSLIEQGEKPDFRQLMNAVNIFLNINNFANYETAIDKPPMSEGFKESLTQFGQPMYSIVAEVDANVHKDDFGWFLQQVINYAKAQSNTELYNDLMSVLKEIQNTYNTKARSQSFPSSQNPSSIFESANNKKDSNVPTTNEKRNTIAL